MLRAYHFSNGLADSWHAGSTQSKQWRIVALSVQASQDQKNKC